jgi:hypothetical protein
MCIDFKNGCEMSTAAIDRSIYARKIPGLTSQNLMDAVEREENKKGVRISDAFTQTSPVMYQHYQNSMNREALGGSRITDLDLESQNRQHEEAIAQRAVSLASAAPSIASLTNTVRAGVASTEESIEKVKKRIIGVDDRIREQQQNAQRVYEKIELIEQKACTSMWLTAVFGSLVLILLIAIFVMLLLHVRKMQKVDSSNDADVINL